MSLTSEKIYRRKPSVVVRQQLLKILLRKYIKKVYGGVVAADRTKQIDRQLLRQEYYSDINVCLLNYCQLTRQTKLLKVVNQFTPTNQRKFIDAIKTSGSTHRRRKVDNTKIGGENSRCSMTITKSNDKNFIENEDTDIGWGKKIQVELLRDSGASFGVCIVGGTVNISSDGQQISGIFIKNIIPSTPAELCKKLKVGDRILAVNGQDVRHASQEYAINLIKNSAENIKLEVQSFDLNDIAAKKTNMDKENDKESDKKSENGDQREPPIQNADDCPMDSSGEDDSDEEESLGKVPTKMGREIDRKSAGNIKRSREEIKADLEPENEFGYTDKKIKKRYANFGNILRIKMNRSSNSMGLALAGHKNRNEMGCFIVGINPKGAASALSFKVGDEILEINGTVLHKMCHLNAAVLIKSIPGAMLEFLILRKDSAEDDLIAVKPVTNFPAVIDQIDQLHSCYKNVRNVAIQKVGPSLGIMIIEGKHSELGQGIFVSDIQESSNAEKAGLLIGEMILAVNKDLLIDCNYDAAASLLKRAEGIVTLVVCNPNKLDEKKAKPDENKNAKKGTDGSVIIAEPVEPEAPVDPIHATIKPNKESIIEINVNNKPLGLFVIGGKMTQSPVNGAYIVFMYANGAASTDKRLQLFDKITEIEGKKITTETSNEDLRRLFKRRYIMAKMTVYREDPLATSEVNIDIARKPGKEIGFNYVECKDYGVLVTDIVAGSATAFDNRLMVGDLITWINGENVRNASFIDCVLLMKASPSSVALKVLRPTAKK